MISAGERPAAARLLRSCKSLGKVITHFPFLGAFAKLRKATISFVVSARPAFRMEQLGY
jgi:hypothetical protein